MSIWISILAVLAMCAGVLMIPFGLPGLWFIVVVTLGLVLAGQVGWTLGLVVAGVAAVAEAAEFLVVARFGRAYGGSRRAFWGAVAGGMLGLFVGFPVPLVGPVITAFIGTFLGAGAVTLLETRSLRRSARVGWGVVLARTVAVALKVGVSVAVIAVVGVALFV
ncbi:MAG: DUF456 domain-containing protein [Gemmatimonadetes bacterium]|nr:DUF456 domain-containing protein [Gemmatimonadota bacterium]NNL29928.1 DUF456 domain-containing protein [Gemmatimonadota bacterium]